MTPLKEATFDIKINISEDDRLDYCTIDYGDGSAVTTFSNIKNVLIVIDDKAGVAYLLGKTVTELSVLEFMNRETMEDVDMSIPITHNYYASTTATIDVYTVNGVHITKTVAVTV
jgi:hypothetical protein